MGNRQFVQYLDRITTRFKSIGRPMGIGLSMRSCLFGRKRKIELPSRRDGEARHAPPGGWQWATYLHAEDLPPLGSVQPKSWRGNQPSWDRADEVQTWAIERGWRPGTFKKIAFTDEELIEAIENSPLAKHLTEVTPREIPRPPLPLDRGHLGLILASGILDGVVECPHGPHVVRGSSRKWNTTTSEASDSDGRPGNWRGNHEGRVLATNGDRYPMRHLRRDDPHFQQRTERGGRRERMTKKQQRHELPEDVCSKCGAHIGYGHPVVSPSNL